VKDQPLACAPVRSSEGPDSFPAMNYAANTAVANHQVIAPQIRDALRWSAEALGMELVSDVAHTIAKGER